MTEQITQGDPAHIRADNLRAKSDALLKLCGWVQTNPGTRYPCWKDPNGDYPELQPHPYANAQDAIDLAEAMGLRPDKIEPGRFAHRDGYGCYMRVASGKLMFGHGPTIAEAISAAIGAAVEERTDG